MELTDLSIRKARPREKAWSLSDGAGLYIWITPTGSKLWRWSYRFEGKEKLMSFGRYPEITLAKAREKHAVARTLLAEGIDPMAQRKADKDAKKTSFENSFQSVATRWLNHWRDGKSPRHADYVNRRLEADVYPLIGSRIITEITAPELVALVQKIQARGAHDVAKRALETVGQIFRFAIARGSCTRNPAVEIRPSDVLRASRKKNHTRIDAKELPHLLRAIEIYQGTPATRLAMRMMALTFVRTSELIGAR